MRRAILWVPVVLAAMLAVFAALQPWVPARSLFADPLIAAEEAVECCSVYFGAMSTLGIFMWMGTAAICLFACLVHRVGMKTINGSSFLLIAGLFTAWLGFDDAFMFHESVAPALGIPQNMVLLIYVGLGLSYLWVIRKRVFDGPWILLGAAFGGFAASLVIDVLVSSHAQWVDALEDGFKFVGIAAWSSYHIAAAFDALAHPRQG